MVETTDRRQGIQSVGIGLRVLDVLASLDGAAALGAIAQASDLSASQAHRYLASLIAAGMARQDAATGRYELGPGALRLGLAALSRMDVFREAAIAIGDYVRETGRTVQMAALGPSGPIVVRWIMGTPPISTSLTVGAPLPLLSSATGHVFLAFRPENQTRAMVERETQPQFQPIDVEALRVRVRRDGYSAVRGDLIPGLRATAVPIFDLQGEAVFTATVLATDLFRPENDDQARDRLIEVCDQITAATGGIRPQV
ncbi:IclR family transcriptional regulator [Brevundimonas sp.]|uniref:IclR family transcriptional regulator n=1 Tax=Brevundimonas sp. TaxID=1871086 RepID=UPI0028A0831E|nr:IclR family transcriptional regulator [Brevundimonas sp.]